MPVNYDDFSFTPEKGRDSHSGFYELWAEVLYIAEEDLSYHPLAQEASHRWFLSKSTEIGSYLWVCEALNRDPRTLLKKHQDKLTRFIKS